MACRTEADLVWGLDMPGTQPTIAKAGLLLVLTSFSAGCVAPRLQEVAPQVAMADIPRELDKMTLPPYRVEPRDVLSIIVHTTEQPVDEAIKPGDILVIRLAGGLPLSPDEDPVQQSFRIINGEYQVQPDGTVDFGPFYGSAEVAGLSINEAKEAIRRYLVEEGGVPDPEISVSMPLTPEFERDIPFQDIVGPDGTFSLGRYGDIYITGLTRNEIKAVVEEHLASELVDPQAEVQVLTYNSQVYYVITEGAGNGSQVVPIPFTGNETVLDAIAEIQGVSNISSNRIWIARPAPSGAPGAQILDVDWRAITQDGITTTNYQVLPGDRIYIKADGLITMDSVIAKVTAPIERLFSTVLLGYSTVRRTQQSRQSFNQSQGGLGF